MTSRATLQNPSRWNKCGGTRQERAAARGGLGRQPLISICKQRYCAVQAQRKSCAGGASCLCEKACADARAYQAGSFARRSCRAKTAYAGGVSVCAHGRRVRHALVNAGRRSGIQSGPRKHAIKCDCGCGGAVRQRRSKGMWGRPHRRFARTAHAAARDEKPGAAIHAAKKAQRISFAQKPKAGTPCGAPAFPFQLSFPRP